MLYKRWWSQIAAGLFMLIASLVSSALTCSPLCCRTGWSIIISCQSLFPLRLILKFFCRPEARKPPWQQVTASSSISFWTWWSTPNYIQSHVHSSLQITSRSCWTSFKKSSASFTDAKSWGTENHIELKICTWNHNGWILLYQVQTYR